MSEHLYRLAAFSTDPTKGNPAGVWIGDALPDNKTMQSIAAEVGYSETAFIAPSSGEIRTIRYYSPLAEVNFCGHATIASAVMVGRLSGIGTYQLDTLVGRIPVKVHSVDGQMQAALTSVEPAHKPVTEQLVDEVLALLQWPSDALDRTIPPALAYGGVWHLILAVNSQYRLNQLDYDFEKLTSWMSREGVTTLQLIFRESDDLFHSRNPFPVGGVVEDPATGAAAAALGGYLRDAKLMDVPGKFLIKQGETMGRLSLLQVEVPEQGGIVVAGTAVEII
ncbi:MULTISPECIES: PhzF family phenazine biosynthesis isomerase [unclassified Halomonas]|uniref:PhzF family phenazine biosynthesis protein n=1 Tax=unclassified Halomonas TaxID=2609666 RepID=UPI0007D99CC7|nr:MULTISPECIES: PhzF family phenazine biosynthesis isomerase [unclassified Halomonas]MBT2785636.1 PhzF family phenazine biosynthesis isomerase [Halomonas sp. ISL-106]MBT2797680.1 PhzF family phenazine biosynthesis isomerase [Halomonas sp. ISL-104]OAL59466.1 phenazine biosynthesis protein PhzF [Halomonas sp. ALS9]